MYGGIKAIYYTKNPCKHSQKKSLTLPIEGYLYLSSLLLLFLLLKPCPGDSADVNALIKQRASETCSRLLSIGALNSSLYTAVGSLYNSHGKYINKLIRETNIAINYLPEKVLISTSPKEVMGLAVGSFKSGEGREV